MNFNQLKTHAILAIIFFSLFGCKKESLDPSGNIISEIRRPGTFKYINTSSSVKINFVYGSEHKLELKGSDNLLSKFQTSIVNNELILGYKNVNLSGSDLEVVVTGPSLEQISLGGSADIDIAGDFPFQEKLIVTLNGSGAVKVNGTMQIDFLKVNSSGSGKTKIGNATAKTAEFNISGTGDIEGTISDYLKASITGTGNIYYHGNPSVQSTIKGSGKVIKL